MPTTTNYGFYTPPLTGVTPNVPRDVKTLADAVDAALKAEETARIAAAPVILQSARKHSTATLIPTGAWTAIPYDVSELDEIPWDATNKRWTVPTDGYYQINAGCLFAVNATGYRGLRISKNAGTLLAQTLHPAVNATGADGNMLSKGTKLVAGDTVQILCFQVSGGNLALSASPPEQVFGDITRIGLA